MSQDASEKLIDLVKRSDLVPQKKLDSFLEKVNAAPEGMPAEQEKLAEMLVADGLLTRWQADKLLAGKHRGFRLGKYKLLGQIGKGGMSHVYLAEHVLMERRVAIKVLPRQRVKDRSYLSRFQLEARAAARLDDPNIVRVYDIDNEGDTHYIVMEYVDGRDLHQTVSQNGALPFVTAVRYITQVATGLQHAHEMGLVHRDIKPANCLLDQHGVVKLLDMGLAKLSDDETSLTLANDENVLGTADYLAPEQALNSHAADARADIYSLGCTLYFLLVGRPPFPEGTISERLLKHQVEEPESLLKLRPDTPLSLVDICSRMMAKKPDDRPQTAGDVARILNDWLADRGESPVGMGSSGSGVRVGEGLGSNAGSGIGSGILSRYSQTPPPGANPAPGSRVKPGGLPNVAGETAKLFSSASVDTDEDIGLAPLDEEEGKSPAARQAKKASASSGVLSDESGAKLGSKASGGSKVSKSSPEKSSLNKSAASKSAPSKSDKGSSKSSALSGVDTGQVDAASLSSPSKPPKPKSIFDEEYATTTEVDPIQRRAQRAAQAAYDPLHPPGYVNPYTKTPAWVYVVVGLFLVAVISIVAWVHNS